ncbi:MAG: Sec-independent protein translocase subunit TatA [Actinomycetota bacterium]|nr:Sec-independent protein translocase subunit TatA [Actinomycetota bacterium]
MGIPGGWELILILAVLVLLFGATKLPNAARSIGQSMRIFKAETKGMRSDDTTPDAAQHQPAQQQPAQHPVPPVSKDGNPALPPTGPQVAPPLEHHPQGHSDPTR